MAADELLQQGGWLMDENSRKQSVIFPPKILVQIGAQNLFYGTGLCLQITL